MSKGGEDVTVDSPVTLSLARSFFSLFLFHRVSWTPTALATFLACARSPRPSSRATRSFPFVFALVEGQPPSHCMPRMQLRVCAFSRLLSFLPVRVCSRRSIHATLVRFVCSFRETIVESLTVVSRASP